MDPIAEDIPERRMAFTCSYVPEEIILASGFNPVPVHPEKPPSDGDSHIYPNTCGYLKSMLAHGLSGDVAAAEGIVFANCCDGMRKLYDIWEKYVSHMHAFLLEVPKKNDPLSTEFFASELRRLSTRIQERTNASRKIEPEEMEAAIRSFNEKRREMSALLSRMAENGAARNASHIYTLCHEASAIHGDSAADQADRTESTTTKDAVRLILVGSRLRSPDLISLVEGSGARVVGLDTCMTTRRFQGLVEEGTGDPYMALARQSLSRMPCPRMDLFEDRFQSLFDLVRESRAGGVIFAPLKFCDTFQYDTLLLRDRLKKAGTPLLILDTDYEPTVPEQVRTRVQAFVETLGSKS